MTFFTGGDVETINSIPSEPAQHRPWPRMMIYPDHGEPPRLRLPVHIIKALDHDGYVATPPEMVICSTTDPPPRAIRAPRDGTGQP